MNQIFSPKILINLITILSLVIFKVYAQNQDCLNKLDLVNSFQFLSCERGQSDQLNQGDSVLINEPPQSKSQLTLVGWYNLKGYLNEQYLLFQAYQNTDDNIFTLAYNPVSKMLLSKVFNESIDYQDISAIIASDMQDKWFFLRIGINLNSENSNTYFIYYLVITSTQSFNQSKYFKQFNKQSPKIYFNNNLSIFYGNKSNYPFSSSCSFSKKVSVYIGTANSFYDSVYKYISPYEQDFEAENVLLLNFSIKSSIPDTLLNLALYNNKDLYNIKFLSSDIAEKEYLSFGPFNFDERSGVIIQFDIKFSGNAVNLKPEFGGIWKTEKPDILEAVYLMKVNKQNGAKFEFSDSFTEVNSSLKTKTFVLEEGKWNRITITFQVQFDQVIKKVYLGNTLQSKFDYTYQEIGVFYFSFLNEKNNQALSTDRTTNLKLVKIYEGSYFQECNECMMIDSNQSCNICNYSTDFYVSSFQSYCHPSNCPVGYIEYENSKTCEWQNSNACAIQGQFQIFNDICQCPDGFYKKQNICFPCPDYCITCQSETQCIEFYSPRSSSGQCDQKEFDDGKQCISKYMKIPSLQNTIELPNKPNIDCNNLQQYKESDFKIQNTAFNIQDDNESFYISFLFQLQPIQPITQLSTYTICYMEDKGVHVFTLLAKIKDINYKQIDLELYFQNQLVITASMQDNQDVQISLLTDLKLFQMEVKQKNSPVSFYNINLNQQIITQLNEAIFYLAGIISPYIQTNYPLCGKIGQYLIMKGHKSMFDFQDIMSQNSSSDIVLIANFNFSEYSDEEIKKSSIIEALNDNTLFFYLQYTNLRFNQIFGLKFEMNNYSQTNLQKVNSQEFAFQFTYYPNTITSYAIATICYQSKNLFYFNIIPHKSNYIANLQICFINKCQNLKYVNIKLDQPNYLFIKFEAKLFNDKTEVVNFDVIINYKFERVSFDQKVSQYLDSSNLYILIGTFMDSVDDHLFYFNNFQIYTEGYYYIDYDVNDPCFLYINRKNMKCIQPKQGYTLHGNKLLKYNECSNERSNDQTILFFNPFTQKCQDSGKNINNCVEIQYKDLNKCLRCVDSLMDPSNNCSCPEGTLYDSVNYKCKCLDSLMDPRNHCSCPNGTIFDPLTSRCQYCSPQCKTCLNNIDHCLICTDEQSKPPNCNCPYQNQYRDQNYQCQICDLKCDECIETSNQCTVCSLGRINPPLCECDQRYYSNLPSDPIDKECEQIQCNKQCLTCLYTSSNCNSCRGDREGIPECKCGEGKYDDPNMIKEFCQSCSFNQYYDYQQMKCKNCSPLCETCFGPSSNNCLSCLSNYRLTSDNECGCSPGFSQVQNDEQTTTCFGFMNILQGISYIDDQYQINIYFEEEIDDLQNQIQMHKVGSLFGFIINEIDQKYYNLKDEYIVRNNNQLILFIELRQSFQSTYCYLFFKNTEIFKNNLNKLVIDSIYKRKPINFNIGPYLFILDNETKDMVATFNSLTPSNTKTLNIIRNLQFVFYFINSVQPSSMFLLVKINVPVNFYSFLQMIGVYVFKEVPDYQTINNTTSYSILGQNVYQYVGSTGYKQLDRLGFANSFYVNCEIILYKYLFLMLSIMIIKGVIIIKYLPKNSQKRQIKHIGYIEQAYIFLIQRLSQENEINLLIVVLSTCIQLSDTNDTNWLNRWSFYMTLIFISIFLISSYYFYYIYNQNDIINNPVYYLQHFYIRLKEKCQIKGGIQKNYHFIQHLKKILLVFFIFFFAENPSTICFIGVLLNLFSAIFTLYVLPYKYLITSLIKGIGDLLQSITWIFMIIFNQYGKQNIGRIEFTEDQIHEFLRYGYYATYCLLIFNFLFFLNFIFECVILKIYQIITKRKLFLVINHQTKNLKKERLIPFIVQNKFVQHKKILI